MAMICGGNVPHNGVPHGIPPELLRLPNWVSYQLLPPLPREKETRDSSTDSEWVQSVHPPVDWSGCVPRSAPAKPRKVPVSPHGGFASAADPETWGTFKEAYSRIDPTLRMNQPPLWPDAGVGFVFRSGGGLVGIDLDGSLEVLPDGRTRRKPWADELLATLPPDAWLEQSVSGTGEHVIVAGAKPGAACKVELPDGAGAVECYDAYRFFALTGERPRGEWGTKPRIVRADLTEFWRVSGLDKAEPVRSASPAEAPETLAPVCVFDPATVADELPVAAQELWHGRGLDQYENDRSRCDYALIGYLRRRYGRDPQLIHQLMMACALRRPKWDTRRGAVTWLQSAILKICGD